VRGGCRQPDGAVDQHRRNARPARSHGVALDPSEAAGDELERRDSGEKCSAPRLRLPRRSRKSPERYAHYMIEGRRPARPEDLKLSRILNAGPSHTLRERFRPHLPVDAGMGAGRAGPTYENTVTTAPGSSRPGARAQKGRPATIRSAGLSYAFRGVRCSQLRVPPPPNRQTREANPRSSARSVPGIGPDTIHASR